MIIFKPNLRSVCLSFLFPTRHWFSIQKDACFGGFLSRCRKKYHHRPKVKSESAEESDEDLFFTRRRLDILAGLAGLGDVPCTVGAPCSCPVRICACANAAPCTCSVRSSAACPVRSCACPTHRPSDSTRPTNHLTKHIDKPQLNQNAQLAQPVSVPGSYAKCN